MRIRFADFELTEAGELRRDGRAVPLQPQPMKVLLLLASRAGELVGRHEIQRHVWGHETFIDFDQGLNWCIGRIREVLGDDAGAPRFVQTVPRRGYRFIAPLRTRSVSGARRRRTGLAALGLVTAFAVVFGAHGRTAGATILVLPFDDLGSGDAVRAADVATAELISTLAQVDPSHLRVIDPLTAMKFKRTTECIITIGRQLDAQFVLLGAVRKKGADLRTTAQLFRVADNRQVWAGEQEVPIGVDPAVAYARMGHEVVSSLAAGIQ